MSPDPDRRRDPGRLVRRIRPRTRVIRAVGRVRGHAPHLLLAGAAAGLAYLLGALAFGPEHAIFAPIAAVVAIGLSSGQRVVRAVEISLGVVLGLVAADLLTRVIGVGSWQLAIAVVLAMAGAVALRASTLMANQAAVAAVFVMVLVPLQDTPPLVRLGDALIGGGVAVLLSSVLSPDPHRVVLRRAHETLTDLAEAYRLLARALERTSLDLTEEAQDRAHRLEGAGDDLDDALKAARERVDLARPRVRSAHRRRLRAVEQLAPRVGMMGTSVRSATRAVATVVRHGGEADPALVTAVEELAGATLELARWTSGEAGRDGVRGAALRAAVTASRVLHQPGTSAAAQALAWQVRAAVVDLLRVLGFSHESAVAELEKAAGRADRHPAGDQADGEPTS